MIGFYNYTVILTYVGLASAVCGIMMALEGSPEAALVCLLIAGVCDLFDGKIARTMDRTKQEKRFGIQIDSLCDLVSFSILPVAIGYSVTSYSRISAVVYTLFVLAAVIRLAYYNVTEEERQETETGDREYFQGMPVTCITIILPILFLFRERMGEAKFPTAVLVVIFLSAVAFVSNVKVMKHPLTSKDGIIAKIHGGNKG